MNWYIRIKKKINKKNLRTRIAKKNSNSRFIQIMNKKYINFSSNDYLGLSHEKKIIKAWKKGAEIYGIGSGGSNYINGYSIEHKLFEEELAKWLNYKKTILFTSGYAANQAVITSLIQKKDIIIADRLSHASIIDAAINSKGKLYRFKHNEIKNLKKLLSSNYKNKMLIITEGVFSMDGDTPKLKIYHKLTKEKNALLMVDDAHGIGINGLQGRGTCWKKNIKPEILIITFGKAFGISGAAVLCDQDIGEYLEQFSKNFIYSTTIPTAQIYALRMSLKCIKKGGDLRKKLKKNIKKFNKLNKYLPYIPKKSKNHIQPIILKDNNKVINLTNKLRKYGYWVHGINTPTVPHNTARIRITINTEHKKQDIKNISEIIYEFQNI
ncbi:8-amino-7-oxononanoate synthase [Candidatus Purcelliella pentastirinorum]|uniref:aminotransferase class I/II-fold pyridoxal phosphate-dependent enzyme n=1 Tax=Candidatus Purcelliella pentastirinorum TaxID=472834 RepID=UPI00237C5075|nr:8-amino-7-oxononanoate synthase [Candidatus Purcelliella pentastirinorum]WDR80498.1 8-amino-7-oxononanoate synthase [Candidatus Purcelliella pentastirinorum]